MSLRFAILVAASALSSVFCAQVSAQSEDVATDVYGPALATQSVAGEERYVYLATTQHLLDGISPEMLEGLRAIGATALIEKDAPEDVDALGTSLNDPLLMQADPASIVAQAVAVIDAGLQHKEEITATLGQMETEIPTLSDPVFALAALNNGVRLRFAIAQALYATELRDLPRSQQEAIAAYAEETFTLRDEMELLDFEIEVEGMVDEALARQRNAYASLQRGVLSEIDPYSFVEDGRRAARMTKQAREGVAAEMRGMLLQILLIGAIIIP